MNKKNLLKIIAIGFITIISQKSYSQIEKGCNVENDPFTGEKVVVYNAKYQNFKFKLLKSGNIEFTLKISYPGDQDQIIKEGTKISVKLKNGTVIEKPTLIDASPIEQVSATQYSSSVYSMYFLPIEISQDELKSLTDSQIQYLRYPDLQGSYVNQELKGLIAKIYTKSISKGANCILDNL